MSVFVTFVGYFLVFNKMQVQRILNIIACAFFTCKDDMLTRVLITFESYLPCGNSEVFLKITLKY